MNRVISTLHRYKGVGVVNNNHNGPKQHVKCVVRALGENFFFLLSTYLLMVFHCIRICVCYEGMKVDGEGGIDQSWPKQHVWHHLGRR